MKRQRNIFFILLVVGIFLSSYVVVFVAGKIIICLSVIDNYNNESSILPVDLKEKSKDISKTSSSELSKQISAENSNMLISDAKEENSSELSLYEENNQNNNYVSNVTETTESNVSTESAVFSQSSDTIEPVAEESNVLSESNYLHSEKLLSYLASAGYSVNDLTSDCKQLITVNSSGSYAEISFFQLNENGIWKEDKDLMTDGYVGSNGVSKDSYEGSKMTPIGLYEVGQAFYIDTVPQTLLDIFQVTNDTYWVDDPNSKFYNQHIEGLENQDWNSAEHMIDYYNSYRFGFVIEFNTKNTIPGKGSAIFFHISSQSTRGCVGVPEGMMLKYLSKLNKYYTPYILIQ